MGVVIPLGFHQAVYRWSLAGDPEEQVTTMGFDIDNFDTLLAKATELYDQAVASGSLTPLAAMNAPWTLVGVTLYRMESGGLTVAVYNNPITATAGSQTTPPNNTALLIQKRTAFAGQKFRGRNYLPPFGVNEGSLSPSGVFTADYSTIAGRIAGWYANMLANEYFPVLLHSDPEEAPTPITSLTLATQVATQRRRMRN